MSDQNTTQKQVESIDGAGQATCATCNGKLDFSYFVKFTDGSHGYFCSEHLPQEIDDSTNSGKIETSGYACEHDLVIHGTCAGCKAELCTWSESFTDEGRAKVRAASAAAELHNIENNGGGTEQDTTEIDDDDTEVDDEQDEQELLVESLVEATGYSEAVIRAYIEIVGEDYVDEGSAAAIEEAYAGEFLSDEDFALNMAEEIGAIDENASWPNDCIDWERAARELMYDYSESNGHYFRSI